MYIGQKYSILNSKLQGTSTDVLRYNYNPVKLGHKKSNLLSNMSLLTQGILVLESRATTSAVSGWSAENTGDTTLWTMCTGLSSNSRGTLFGSAFLRRLGMTKSVKKKDNYRKISNIRRNRSQNLNDSHLALQSSLPNPLKPGVKSRMKI